ncbi:MAG: hypothetical protein JRJ57_00850 [Deltaproteobacteria bacterium]|nr:hypothetical protein [Deltaproteobacteria bacterium]
MKSNKKIIDLIIIGAGENGSIVIDIIDEINTESKRYNIIGLLDDDPFKIGKNFYGFPILGSIGDWNKYPNVWFTSPLITSPKKNHLKKLVVNREGIPDERFVNIIHPGVRVKYSVIGTANLITKGVVLFPGSKIGNHCYISSNVLIGPNTVIEDYVNISNSSSIQGKTKIREGAYIGAGSRLIGNIEIGKWSIVGIGSNVLHSNNEYDIIVGNPAKIINKNDIAKEYELRKWE